MEVEEADNRAPAPTEKLRVIVAGLGGGGQVVRPDSQA